MQPKFDKNNKRFKILILYLGYNGMIKKSVSGPLKYPRRENITDIPVERPDE
jgi:hypothetical protein